MTFIYILNLSFAKLLSRIYNCCKKRYHYSLLIDVIYLFMYMYNTTPIPIILLYNGIERSPSSIHNYNVLK